MSRLFTTERESAGTELLEDVTVTDSGGTHGDPGIGHRQMQPEVAHHRGDERVVLEAAGIFHGTGQNGHDGVAVDDLSRGIDGEAAVRVAVVSESEVGSVFQNCCLNPVEMC